jgi:hypothetical protein
LSGKVLQHVFPTFISAQLIAWLQHLQAKGIGIVTDDFVCDMV